MYEASLPLVAHLEPHRLTTLAATARLVGDLTPLVILFTATDILPTYPHKSRTLGAFWRLVHVHIGKLSMG